ncbi:MAG TPA: PEGA domain-containing protein [Kofleriaceae bacterium]|nr:PEGA domain-containing protein [Kofleriaceae bacterium]
MTDRSVRVPVTTFPAGATVLVNDEPVGQTPMVVELDRGQSAAQLKLVLPGYQSILVARGKHLSGWFFGNLLLGGLVGIAIDAATGAARTFDDTPVQVELTPGTGELALSATTAAQPAGSAECRAARRRVFEDAKDTPDPKLRLAKLRSAPVCK